MQKRPTHYVEQRVAELKHPKLIAPHKRDVRKKQLHIKRDVQKRPTNYVEQFALEFKHPTLVAPPKHVPKDVQKRNICTSKET